MFAIVLVSFFSLLLVFTLMVIFFETVGWLYPKTVTSTATVSLFHEPGKVMESISDIQVIPDWKPGVLKIKTGSDRKNWSEQFNDNDGLEYRLLSQNDENIVLESKGPGSAFLLNRTFKIWQRDYMSFISVEDKLTINKPYLRILSKFFYNHPKFAVRELASLENYLDSRYGLSF